MTTNCCEHGILMTIDEDSKSFRFKASDGCSREGTPEETLISDVPLDITLEDNKDFWLYVARDPTNEKIYKNCIKCKNDIVAKVRIKDEVPVYACECGAKWIGAGPL